MGQVVEAEEIQQELDTLLYKHRLDSPSQLVGWAAEHLATLGDVRQWASEKLLSQKARQIFISKPGPGANETASAGL